MRRREFIAQLTTTIAWPVIALAQTKVWRIAMLETATAELNKVNLATFKRRLEELGYIEGQNLVIHYRSPEGPNERLPTLVSELILFNPDVIVVRGTPEVLALKRATSTIPIVMSAVANPVGDGVVASYSRPGGNITGLASAAADIETKRVEYLKEIVPGMKRMASLGDFRNPNIHLQWAQVQAAAPALGIEPLRFDVRSAADLMRAFETAAASDVQAVRVGVDGIIRIHRRLIIELAAKHRLPAIYSAREFAEDGGLMSYSPDYTHLYWRAASFVDRIFKGAKPADLPVELPSKFELVLNLKTANALGIAVAPTLLARADEVIE
jgi:putative ABC transport system substrate-binding protein